MQKNREKRQEAAAERAASKRTPAEQLDHLNKNNFRGLERTCPPIEGARQ